MRKKLVYIFTLTVVVLAISALVVAQVAFRIKFFFEPVWLSVIASLVLAGLTAIYVLQTQGMLKEMTKARKAEFQPHIKASLERVGPIAVELLLKNVGKGAAIDVHAKFSVQPSEEAEKNWHHPLLSPGDSELFFLEPSDLKELAERYDAVVVHGSCKDVFGELHEIDERIDLKKVQKGWHEPGVVLKGSLEERVREIGKKLERISTKIEGTTRYRPSIPMMVRIGGLELREPPLEGVVFGGIMAHFRGKILKDKKILAQLKKFREGDIEEVYCVDRHGMIVSGVFEIKRIDLSEEKVGKKTIYSFHFALERK